jgi:hypothetical protein
MDHEPSSYMKKDSSLHYCVEARSANRLALTDVYALPRIDTCMESFDNGRWFSSLDCASAYRQVPITDKASRDHTAFLTRRGLWRWKVMGYGFCKAIATYSRLVDILLSYLQYESCLAFLDDICVFGNSFEQAC